MPRFYFHLNVKNSHIPDDTGKELDSLNDAYEHAWTLIYKILFHVGNDDAKAWKVVISNEEHDAQIIVPFPASWFSVNAESPCGKFEARRWLQRQLIGGALVGRREMKQVPGSFAAVHVHDRLGLTTERISLLSV